MVVGLPALLLCPPGRVARSGQLLFPSDDWKYTASSTDRQGSWWAWIVWGSSVEQSCLSTGFDLTLKRLVSTEISGPCPPEPGERLKPPWLPVSRFLLTAPSNRWLPLQISLRPKSCPPVPVYVPCQCLGVGVSCWLWFVNLWQSVSVSLTQYTHIAGVRTAFSVGL